MVVNNQVVEVNFIEGVSPPAEVLGRAGHVLLLVQIAVQADRRLGGVFEAFLTKLLFAEMTPLQDALLSLPAVVAEVVPAQHAALKLVVAAELLALIADQVPVALVVIEQLKLTLDDIGEHFHLFETLGLEAGYDLL